MKVINADRFARLPPRRMGAADTGTVILQAGLVNADRVLWGAQAPLGAARRHHTAQGRDSAGFSGRGRPERRLRLRQRGWQEGDRLDDQQAARRICVIAIAVCVEQVVVTTGRCRLDSAPSSP